MKGMGKVYFLQREDGLIKIGYSSDIDARIDQLNRSHKGLKVLRVIHGDQRRETMIHQQLKAHREYGEWFRPEAQVFDFISSVEDGEFHALQANPKKKAWAKFEDDHAAECRKTAEKFYQLCYGWRGANATQVYDYIAANYGIAPRIFNRLLCGVTKAPSSALMTRVREAYLSEMTTLRDHLLEEVREAKASEPDAGELLFGDEIARLQSKLNDIRNGLTQH